MYSPLITITACTLALVCIILISAFLAVVAYIHYIHHKYRHIPGPPRQSFFLGNIPQLKCYADQHKIHGDAVLDCYNVFHDIKLAKSPHCPEEHKYLYKHVFWFSQLFLQRLKLEDMAGIACFSMPIMRSKEYGPVMIMYVLWYGLIFIHTPEAVKEILVTTNYPKSRIIYNKVASIWGNRFMGKGLVTELNHKKWERARNLYNPAFHRSYLKTCMDQFNASSDMIVQQLKKKTDGKTEVTMLEELNKVAMDIIGKVAFGEDFHIYDDTEEEECRFTKSVTCAMHGITYAEEHPWDQFNPSKWARKFRRNFSESVQFIRDAGRRCIEKQLELIRNGQPLTNNVLAHILQAACADTDGLPEMEEMIDQFVTFFIAGQETTANMLSWTIKELTRNPQITYRLKTEVDAVLGDRSDISFEDLPKLEYMMAVLKESLRMYPPATGTVREAPAECVFSGVKIPKGSIMVVLTYTMSRMEEYFKDPLTYDPDRFLHDEDKGMYAYYPFSLGPRSCIGQQFALIEARVVLSKLLQNFEFEWVPGQSDGMIEEITTKPKDGCKCYVKLAS